ncbi:beta-1,4-galactosyltransferase 1-like [Pectinophora gossypiella]|uniref:beta-1,4-galactosyltransferase 1-like n=1 Tax=Pectinophora gossypiella TaxID=13191 RepID=UPI00214E1FD0|nr:beta-1,4-galactosyltransferase 1-like [Pectinophora gossypiella]
MRMSYKKKVFYIGLFIIILIIFMHPDMQGVRSYEFIAKEKIISSLHEELATNFTSSAISNCEYYANVYDETVLSPTLVDGDLVESHKIKEGGEYAPVECKPKYSTAIIVPYRDRAEQLRGFLVYMHTFLHYQRIHYRIYVVEQIDTKPFNRAKLLNIGAKAAIKAGFPCLILHDVDLLPLRPANLYMCTKQPRHMSSSINKFRFVLPYVNLFGGVVAILSKQFQTINGMSNEYFGWGGEDDDLFMRLEDHDLKLCRFDPEISKYHMSIHSSQQKGEEIKKLLSSAKERMSTDGLNSLKYAEVATVMHPLFTHIMVDLEQK